MNIYTKELKKIFPKTAKAIKFHAEIGNDWYDGWPREGLSQRIKDYQLNREQLIELFCKREFIWQFGEDIKGNCVPTFLTLNQLDNWGK